MRKFLVMAVLIAIPTHAENWNGLTEQETKANAINQKILYLYENYPPNETGWMYDISRSLD